MRRVLVVLGFALLAVQPLLAQEVIGPFTIGQAPASATASFSNDYWANVVNVAITADEAFSGFSIIDRGWVNIDVGDFYEVTFSPPIVNGAGPDIVVFDARYDAGAYSVSTAYDGFAASAAPSAWQDTGESRSYYYGGSGPATAEVWGSSFDLSSVGVPAGATVATIRVAATNTGCDPLGVGGIAAQAQQERAIPTLSTAGLIALVLLTSAAAVLVIRRRML